MIVRTDFRAGGDALPGQTLATINLMLSRAATAVVNLVDPTAGIEELATELIAKLESLPATPPRLERLPS